MSKLILQDAKEEKLKGRRVILLEVLEEWEVGSQSRHVELFMLSNVSQCTNVFSLTCLHKQTCRTEQI